MGKKGKGSSSLIFGEKPYETEASPYLRKGEGPFIDGGGLGSILAHI